MNLLATMHKQKKEKQSIAYTVEIVIDHTIEVVSLFYTILETIEFQTLLL